DRRQARVDAFETRARSQVEIDFIKTVRSQLGGDEIDEASIRRADRRNLELVRPDPAVESRAIERGGAVQRSYAVIGCQAHRTDRRAVLGKVRPRKRIGLGVQHKIDVALLIERNLFGSMAAGAREAERFEEATEGRLGFRVDGELEKRNAVEPRRLRRIEQRDTAKRLRCG